MGDLGPAAVVRANALGGGSRSRGCPVQALTISRRFATTSPTAVRVGGPYPGRAGEAKIEKRKKMRVPARRYKGPHFRLLGCTSAVTLPFSVDPQPLTDLSG